MRAAAVCVLSLQSYATAWWRFATFFFWAERREGCFTERIKTEQASRREEVEKEETGMRETGRERSGSQSEYLFLSMTESRQG